MVKIVHTKCYLHAHRPPIFLCALTNVFKFRDCSLLKKSEDTVDHAIQDFSDDVFKKKNVNNNDYNVNSGYIVSWD